MNSPTHLLHDRMNLVRDICSTGRKARNTAGIAVRQPIRSIVVLLKPNNLQHLDWLKLPEIQEMIMDELNCKEVKFLSV